MKKSMLCAGLITLLSLNAYAENNTKAKTVKTPPASAKAQLKKGAKTLKSSALKPIKAKQQRVASSAKKSPVKVAALNKKVAAPVKPAAAASKQVAASGTQTPPVTGTPTSDTQNPVSDSKAPAPAADTQVPVSTSTSPATNTQAAPVTGTQAPATTTQTPATGTQTPAAAVKPAEPLNCNYRIPAQTTHIEQTLVMKWAEKAAEQAFDFDFKTIDPQVTKLKACFTDQGWQGFNDALEKSGNLTTIRSQQLTVNSMVNGQSKITEIKDNQWKVTIPLQVVYQNEKEKLTQALNVDLIVGRKTSGNLGIMQMIAVPK